VNVELALPLQARSQRTLDAILSATERLLISKTFEAISVDEITGRARVSTGSFYARLPRKEALLPVLYERYEARLAEHTSRLVTEIESCKSLADACGLIVTAVAGVLRQNPNLMRAMTALTRRDGGGAFGPSPRRQQIHRSIELALTRFRGPVEEGKWLAAVRAATFMASCMLREAILYSHAPFAQVTEAGLGVESTVTEIMTAYLEGRPKCDPGG